MARALLILAIVLGGCRDPAQSGADASTDDASLGADAALTFPWSNGASSDDLVGVEEVVISTDATLFADTGQILAADGSTLRPQGGGVMAGIYVQTRPSQPTIVGFDRLTIEPQATLRIAGTVPVVLASRTTIDIDGTIDASAGICPDGSLSRSCGGPGGGDGGTTGAGATGCGPGGIGEGLGDTGGGGGALAADAGAGGAETDDNMNPGGSAGLATQCPDDLVPLIGGSGGARPGGSLGNGIGGGGGGGLQLSANLSVTIGGVVRAVGEGGVGANNGGGGGGGSGGAILVEASAITVSGVITANGGGGGAGGMPAAGQRGNDSSVPALGGGGTGAAGGNGGTGVQRATDGADDTNDTGGGGGSAGIVQTISFGISVAPAAVVTPPSTDSIIE